MNDKVKVFVSWSGEISQIVAKTLHQYIPIIIQSVDVFYSPEDIEKGANWGSTLQEELSSSSYGIVCLTPQNVVAPWINFEAGAIAKSLDSRVSSILIGVKPSDIKGPLTGFQATGASRDDFFRLVKSINNAVDSPLDGERLEKSFDAHWPSIEESLKKAEAAAKADKGKGKADASSEPDPQELILQSVRSIALQISSPESLLPPSYIKSIISQINHQEAATRPKDYRRESPVSNIEIEILSFTIEFVNSIQELMMNANPEDDIIYVPRDFLMHYLDELMQSLSLINPESLPGRLRLRLNKVLNRMRIVRIRSEV